MNPFDPQDADKFESSGKPKGKQILVRVPASEVEAIEAICSEFPGASPALLFRAALLSMRKTGMVNALAKHAAEKVRKGFNECEK